MRLLARPREGKAAALNAAATRIKETSKEKMAAIMGPLGGMGGMPGIPGLF